jgi:hypothetical protein
MFSFLLLGGFQGWMKNTNVNTKIEKKWKYFEGVES